VKTTSRLMRTALALTLLGTATLGQSEQEFAANADLSTAPRVTIDRPKPTFMLMQRDKRIYGLKPFQELVDQAAPGSVLKPPPGVYAGPVTIDKPLTIDGGGQVTIDAGDKGTVMILNAANSVLRGLRLTGSGDSHDTDDSCLDVRGHHNLIEDIVADNCLFGIDLKQVSNSTVRRNKISSKDFELGVRGDGLRLWYSHDNLIEGNEIIDSRDMVAWYSHRNRFIDNLGRRSRYSIHFMFANDNVVDRNRSTTTPSVSTSCTPKVAARPTTSSRTPPAPPAWASASRKRRVR
jgi:nitrous oxidase accessory protein